MEDKCIIMAFIQSVTDNPLHLCLVILYDVSAEDTLCSSNHHVSTRGGGGGPLHRISLWNNK